ncbi:hypothetical protein J2Z35_002481 [Acetoanaerobium pronyense]|uniref:Uncharacterized protein n=1 Tax=Acetoanaerobium pronyense TaxID=1482736 RepID=A0ABS4KND5_9FIRM|nr:hypothetical protein [Acetoanaerobium pronyense]
MNHLIGTGGEYEKADESSGKISNVFLSSP